jgi:predicted amino acid racemase
MVDLLGAVIERNPALIAEAVSLHQDGLIPPDTFVIDTDSIAKNTTVISERAASGGIGLYYMSKQFGRNPAVCHYIEKSGVEKAVTIDIDECKILHNYGFKIGHVGNLSQVPRADVDFVVGTVRPDVVTIYSLAAAKNISEAAIKAGVNQKVLLRVRDRNDFSYPRQISPGGFTYENIAHVLNELGKMKNIEISGVTSFPVFRTDISRREVFPLPNAETLVRSARRMSEAGIKIWQINMPADNSSDMFGLAKTAAREFGNSVWLEPGHGISGTTPLHAFRSDLPEIPSIVYATEISHSAGGEFYALGGGMMGADMVTGIWSTDFHHFYMHALTARNPESIMEGQSLASQVGFIDYYIPVRSATSSDLNARSGDTVILGFRPQIFVTRSHVAAVKGIQKGRAELLGIFDSRGNLLERRTLRTRSTEETEDYVKSL